MERFLKNTSEGALDMRTGNPIFCRDVKIACKVLTSFQVTTYSHLLSIWKNSVEIGTDLEQVVTKDIFCFC